MRTAYDRRGPSLEDRSQYGDPVFVWAVSAKHARRKLGVRRGVVRRTGLIRRHSIRYVVWERLG